MFPKYFKVELIWVFDSLVQDHIVFALSTTDKIGVLEHDDNGDAMSMVDRNTSDITPSETEWRLAAESSVLLGKVYEAT